MTKFYSINEGRIVNDNEFRMAVVEDRKAQTSGHGKAADEGLLHQDLMILDQLAEEDSLKASVKTIILKGKASKAQALGDKIRKGHRKITVDMMPAYLEEVQRNGIVPLPVSEEWLGDGMIGTGTFHQSAAARRNGDNSITTIFKLRGLTSRMKSHHWTDGHTIVKAVVVLDELEEFVTPMGEMLAGPNVTNHKFEMMAKPSPTESAIKIERQVRSARVVSPCGLKGMTVPCLDLGTIKTVDGIHDVDIIAGPNSIKAGMLTAKIIGHQLETKQEFKLSKTQLDKLEPLEGEWLLPDGTTRQVKYGLAFLRVTEMSDQFDNFNRHSMGTEVVRMLELTGNFDAVNHCQSLLEIGDDIRFRQYMGELPMPIGTVRLNRKWFKRTTQWNITSKVPDWDMVPLPPVDCHFGGVVIPSKSTVEAASTLTPEGFWIMPTWGKAAASLVLYFLMGERQTEKYKEAIKQHLAGKKGVQRMAARPKVPCLQGKQVGSYATAPGIVGTTNSRHHGRKAMTIRYPLLWSQIAKSTIELIGTGASARIHNKWNETTCFEIDTANCQGLLFRNVDDCFWEQSDADGDTCFNYILPREIWQGMTEYTSSYSAEQKMKYTEAEVGQPLKEREVTTFSHEEVMAEMLQASINKSLIGQATIDLWKLQDNLYGILPNETILEIVDRAAFYIQDNVVRGIKHDGASGYTLEWFLQCQPELKDYRRQIQLALDEDLEVTLARLGLTYQTRSDLTGNASWSSDWFNRAYTPKDFSAEVAALLSK